MSEGLLGNNVENGKKGGRPPRASRLTQDVYTKRYEYMTLPKNLATEFELNKLGDQGWLMIGVDSYYIYFSRNK